MNKEKKQLTKEEKEERIKSRLFEITAKAILVRDNDEVLLLKRSSGEIVYADKYDLPGGSVEKGEKINESLEREIKEETNLDAEIGPMVYIFDFERDYYLDREKKKKMFLQSKGLRFLAFYKNGEIKLSGEHQSYEWLEIDKAIDKLENEGYEKDKKEALIKAKEYLEMRKANDNWKRCAADFENYKKRQTENQKDLIAYSNINLILEILPVLDNFHISTDHVPEDQKKSPWVVGIMHIQKQLEKVLEDNGVKEIVVKEGDKFDPEIHEAVGDANLPASPAGGRIHANQRMEENSIKEQGIKKILQKGYKINNKVIRAARVIVE
jgi:molecular chaperone GrpE